jgi:hypothetical protein
MSSAPIGPKAVPSLLQRWGWDSYDLAVIVAWLEVCAVLVIWLS